MENTKNTYKEILEEFDKEFDNGQWQNCMMPSDWEKKKSRMKAYISNLIFNALHAYEEATRLKIEEPNDDWRTLFDDGFNHAVSDQAQKRKAFWGE